MSNYRLQNVSRINNQMELVWFLKEVMLYTSTVDGEVYKIDAETQTETLIYQDPNPNARLYNIAIDPDNYIYIASSNFETIKIDHKGNVVWIFSQHASVPDGVAVDDNGYVYSGDRDDDLYKITPDGQTEWVYNHTNGINTTFVDTNYNIYIGDDNGDITKFNSNGNKLWDYPMGDTVYDLTVDLNGNVYANNRLQEIHKINNNGSNLWEYNNYTSIPRHIAIDNNGSVYTSEDDNIVHKIDSNGNNIWTYDTGDTARGVTVDQDYNVYTTNTDFIYKIDLNGDLVWEKSLTGSFLKIKAYPGDYGAGFWN